MCGESINYVLSQWRSHIGCRTDSVCKFRKQRLMEWTFDWIADDHHCYKKKRWIECRTQISFLCVPLFLSLCVWCVNMILKRSSIELRDENDFPCLRYISLRDPKGTVTHSEAVPMGECRGDERHQRHRSVIVQDRWWPKGSICSCQWKRRKSLPVFLLSFLLATRCWWRPKHDHPVLMRCFSPSHQHCEASRWLHGVLWHLNEWKSNEGKFMHYSKIRVYAMVITPMRTVGWALGSRISSSTDCRVAWQLTMYSAKVTFMNAIACTVVCPLWALATPKARGPLLFSILSFWGKTSFLTVLLFSFR